MLCFMLMIQMLPRFQDNKKLAHHHSFHSEFYEGPFVTLYTPRAAGGNVCLMNGLTPVILHTSLEVKFL